MAEQVLELNEDIASTINGAVHDRPIALAYVGEDGLPHLSFRGSTHVHGPQQLAVWARKKDNGLAAAVSMHPDVSLVYYKPGTPPGYLSIRGRARVEPSANETVWANTPQPEKDAVPQAEATGVAVIIDDDYVTGVVNAGGLFEMRREKRSE